jgi:predicted N-formylglutamate amidohydrolase
MNMTAPSAYSPYEILPGADGSRFLLTCDHASNHVPDFVADGDLGLPEAEMGRHIAYDIGAAGVTRHLARLLNAPAVLSNFSRLVIDPNRGPHDPTIVMKLYDGTIIPANRHVDGDEITRRKGLLYDPYHNAVAAQADQMAAPVIFASHSFTPRLNGRAPRPWHVGILHAHDQRYSRPLLDLLHQESDLCVGENEPYAGHLPGDAVDRHALQKNRPNALIELRHDLIADEDGQKRWAERLAPIMEQALRLMDERTPDNG